MQTCVLLHKISTQGNLGCVLCQDSGWRAMAAPGCLLHSLFTGAALAAIPHPLHYLPPGPPGTAEGGAYLNKSVQIPLLAGGGRHLEL